MHSVSLCAHKSDLHHVEENVISTVSNCKRSAHIHGQGNALSDSDSIQREYAHTRS